MNESKVKDSKSFADVSLQQLKDESFFQEKQPLILNEFKDIEAMCKKRECIISGQGAMVKTGEEEDRFGEARKHREQIFSTKTQKITLPFDGNRVKIENHNNFYYNATQFNSQLLLEEESLCQQINNSSVPAHGLILAGQKPLTKKTIRTFWTMVHHKKISTVISLRWFDPKTRFGQPNTPPEEMIYWPSAEDGELTVAEYLSSTESQNNFHLKFLSRQTLDSSPFQVMLDMITIQLQVKNIPNKNNVVESETDGGGKVQQREVKIFIANWGDGEAFVPHNFWTLVGHWEGLLPTGNTFIHCTAGVGRTGTFLTTYFLLLHIRKMRKKLGAAGASHQIDQITINVPAMVLRLRQQRASMVETFPQYFSIYENLIFLLESNTDLDGFPLQLVHT